MAWHALANQAVGSYSHRCTLDSSTKQRLGPHGWNQGWALAQLAALGGALAAATMASGTCMFVGEAVRRYSDYATTPICCGVLSILAATPTDELV